MKNTAASFVLAVIASSAHAQTITVTPGVEVGPPHRVAPFHAAPTSGFERAGGVMLRGDGFLALTSKRLRGQDIVRVTPVDRNGVPNHTATYDIASATFTTVQFASLEGGGMAVILRSVTSAPGTISALPLDANGSPREEVTLSTNASPDVMIGCNANRCLVTWHDPAGRTTGTIIDANGRPVLTALPLPNISEIASDPNGFAATTDEGHLIRLDATTGRVTFDATFATATPAGYAAPVFDGRDYVVFWTASPPRPQLADDHLYAARIALDGRILEQQRSFYREVEHHPLAKGFTGLQAIWNGRQFLVMYAFAFVSDFSPPSRMYALPVDANLAAVRDAVLVQSDDGGAHPVGIVWNGTTYYAISTHDRIGGVQVARGSLLTELGDVANRTPISIEGKTQWALDLLPGASTKLAVWYEDTDYLYTPYAHRLDAQGAPIGTTIAIAGSDPSYRPKSNSAAIGGDEYVITTYHAPDWTAIIVHADGTTTTVDLPFLRGRDEIAVASNGSNWLILSMSPGGAHEIEADLFTRAGQRINPSPIVVDTDGFRGLLHLSATSDGDRYLVAWERGSAGCSACAGRWYGVLSANGDVVHKEFVDSTILEDYLGAAPGDGFAIAYTIYPRAKELHVRRIDRNGNPGPLQTPLVATPNDSFYPAKFVHLGNGWLVSWTFSWLHLGAHLTDSGQLVSHPFLLDIGFEQLQTLTANANGTVDAMYWAPDRDDEGADPGLALVAHSIVATPRLANTPSIAKTTH